MENDFWTQVVVNNSDVEPISVTIEPWALGFELPTRRKLRIRLRRRNRSLSEVQVEYRTQRTVLVWVEGEVGMVSVDLQTDSGDWEEQCAMAMG